MKIALLILILPLLTHCASQSGASATPPPVLSSPARSQEWGSPSSITNASGYVSTYTNPYNPQEQVRIFGSHKLMPFFIYPPNIKGSKLVNDIPTKTEERQLWAKELVNGTSVKFYQLTFPNYDGIAEFHTLGVTLKNQAGASAQYRVEAKGTKNQVRTWLSELRFDQ